MDLKGTIDNQSESVVTSREPRSTRWIRLTTSNIFFLILSVHYLLIDETPRSLLKVV